MRMGDMEITLREVLVSAVILLLAATVGFLISNGIYDHITENNDKYFKSLKVNDKPDILQHAINTEVGYVMSYGLFEADNPVSDDMIDGEYSSIVKVEEHYVMKTRTVSYSCGKSTCTRTETYWEWDEVDRDRFDTDTYSYLGQTITSKELDVDNHYHLDTVKKSSHVRFIFYVIPAKFNGSLFAYSRDKKLSQHELYYEQNIKQVMTDKENEPDTYTMIFWIMWLVLTLVSVFIFYYLDNEWLKKLGRN